jgi:hypothetical protein
MTTPDPLLETLDLASFAEWLDGIAARLASGPEEERRALRPGAPADRAWWVPAALGWGRCTRGRRSEIGRLFPRRRAKSAVAFTAAGRPALSSC